MLVLDTSALLFWTFAPDRLTDRASSAIADADRIILSSISIWEVGVKQARKKLDIPLSAHEFAQMVGDLERVEIVPVDVATWLTNIDLDWENRDPADRTIVATATRLECELVTSDRSMRRFYDRAIW